MFRSDIKLLQLVVIASVSTYFSIFSFFVVQLLGRAKNVSDFIRHGREKAIIEIQLCVAGNSRGRVVRREIHKDNTSEWRINGTTDLEFCFVFALFYLSVSVLNCLFGK
jgi:hypothetical protein